MHPYLEQREHLRARDAGLGQRAPECGRVRIRGADRVVANLLERGRLLGFDGATSGRDLQRSGSCEGENRARVRLFVNSKPDSAEIDAAAPVHKCECKSVEATCINAPTRQR
jgi:hypothetical protein